MTPFEHFQTATCLIAENRNEEATRHIDSAICSLAGRRLRDEVLIIELRKLRRSIAR